ncbi:hypothetical protein GGR56DRAFT_673231 [Xylariaceae sp. FL0804]|nr:hypothetical protein GGR56DRAFT_673231 [Xylariaceae sp. FL0804]
MDDDFHLLTARKVDLIDNSIGSSNDPAAIPLEPRVILTVLEAIAIYNSVELYFIIFFTFRRRRGLYFWSLLVAAAGIPFISAGYILNNYGVVSPRWVPMVIILAAWMPVVAGEALVLYSRLHLLRVPRRTLRLVLVMIILTCALCFIPAWPIVLGANIANDRQEQFLIVYSVWEKVQVTVFFLQESVISGIYLRKAWVFWFDRSMGKQAKVRGMLVHLVVVNMLVVLLDFTVLYLEYSNYYLLQTTYKTFVYSVKLKVEISILNKLVDFVKTATTIENHDRLTQQMEEEWIRTLETNFSGPPRQGPTSTHTTGSAGASMSTEATKQADRRMPAAILHAPFAVVRRGSKDDELETKEKSPEISWESSTHDPSQHRRDAP